MKAGDLWRERARPLVLFPGLILLALAVEVGVLRPQAAERAPAQSVDFWERHAAAHPDYGSSQIRVGQEYQLQGRSDEARAAYHRALRVDPDSWFAAIGLNGVTRTNDGMSSIPRIGPTRRWPPGSPRIGEGWKSSRERSRTPGRSTRTPSEG